jgi:mRNA interferase HigB
VRVIAKSALRAFWQRFADAEGPLLAWFREVEKEHWRSPADVKQKYRHASIVGDRVVFNIKGNRYRLVVRINYALEVVFVRFVGTHEEYDRIDVREV